MRRIVIPRLGLAWLWLKPASSYFFSAVYGALKVPEKLQSLPGMLKNGPLRFSPEKTGSN
jgi:hypothetical protein